MTGKIYFQMYVYKRRAMFERLTCWKGDIFFRMDEGISCSLCELCKKDSQRSESLKHKDW